MRWTLPDRKATVGALAVDDEPTVFWDGTEADQHVAARREHVGWKAE